VIGLHSLQDSPEQGCAESTPLRQALAEELDQIRLLIEEPGIEETSDELRVLVESHWPWLLEKLPPRVTH
jgi:hypothetical protein